MLLYKFNPTLIKETDQEPDPLYNPNEITRVKDILDLHKRGISVSRPINSRGPFDDSREDFVKLSSPNLEIDKLFPSIPRLDSQKHHREHNLLIQKRYEEQKVLDFEQLEEISEQIREKENLPYLYKDTLYGNDSYK